MASRCRLNACRDASCKRSSRQYHCRWRGMCTSKRTDNFLALRPSRIVYLKLRIIRSIKLLVEPGKNSRSCVRSR